MSVALVLDDLDRKLAGAFAGRVVRKDLVKRLKTGFSIPVYVLEYLLGKYCSSTDPQEIEEGLKLVKSAIAERIVRGDENELVKARLQRSGSLKLIDMVTATFDEKVQGGKFWARLATCNPRRRVPSPRLIPPHGARISRCTCPAPRPGKLRLQSEHPGSVLPREGTDRSPMKSSSSY